MNSNEKKASQLGMPAATARQILIKSLLYKMAQKLGADLCYRCKIKIDNIDDFSIDHIIDWLDTGNAIELYFDTDNVAFSHTLCNTLAGSGGFIRGHTPVNKYRPVPNGMAWCGKEQKFRLISEFSSDRHRWNKLQDICIECRKTYRNGRG